MSGRKLTASLLARADADPLRPRNLKTISKLEDKTLARSKPDVPGPHDDMSNEHVHACLQQAQVNGISMLLFEEWSRV